MICPSHVPWRWFAPSTSVFPFRSMDASVRKTTSNEPSVSLIGNPEEPRDLRWNRCHGLGGRISLSSGFEDRRAWHERKEGQGRRRVDRTCPGWTNLLREFLWTRRGRECRDNGTMKPSFNENERDSNSRSLSIQEKIQTSTWRTSIFLKNQTCPTLTILHTFSWEDGSGRAGYHPHPGPTRPGNNQSCPWTAACTP